MAVAVLLVEYFVEYCTQMAMQLVNCSVYCNARSKTLLLWTIKKVPEPDFTFRVFFTQEVLQRIEKRDGLQLQSAHAGRSKETLDHVELDLSVQAVVVSFGPFVKFQTTLSSEPSLPCVVISHNAFALLMSGTRSMATQGLTKKRVEHTGKDRLYNDILKFLEVRNLKFGSDAKKLLERSWSNHSRRLCGILMDITC